MKQLAAISAGAIDLLRIAGAVTATGLVGAFILQNTDAVTVDFLRWSISAPVALAAAAFAGLGMVAGVLIGFAIFRRRRTTPDAKA